MRGGALAIVLAAGVMLGGCAAEPAHSSASAVPAPPLVRKAAASASPSPVDRAQVAAAALVGAMSLGEVAGQLVMTAATVDRLRSVRPVVARYHLAGVMVRGRSSAGTKAVGSAVAAVQSAAPAHLPFLVATDQEGGAVQVLRGPGFSAIPSATTQATRSPARLRSDAHRWGAALRKAGITVDLAPVADVPCAAHAAHNPPIGDLDRNYGRSFDGAGRSVAAVVRGLGDAGVADRKSVV